MEELIKGIPLYPEQEDWEAAMDRLDEITEHCTTWGLFLYSPAKDAVERNIARRQETWLGSLVRAFSIGYMSGVHSERARRKAKAAGQILQRKGEQP